MVRYAIVGLRSMGKKYAAILNSNIVKNAMITAVVCRSENTKKWAEDNLFGVRICSDSDSLYQYKDEFDVVLIVTPHKSHPKLAMQAFAQGKAVFCDKPAGVSVLDAKMMSDEAKKRGILYGMMFHQRLYKKHIRMKEIIDSGVLGKLLRISAVNTRYYRTKFYHESGSWRSSWEGEGGGALINQGQHIIDLWQWLFGMPEKIYADVEFGKYNEFKVDDEATIFMKYNNNLTGVFVLTTGEGENKERMEISGTKGKLTMVGNKLTIIKYNEDTMIYGKSAQCTSRQELTYDEMSEEYNQTSEPYVDMLENFADAYENGGKLVSPGNAGLNVLEIVNGAYMSAWKHAEVKLPIDAYEYDRMLKEQVD